MKYNYSLYRRFHQIIVAAVKPMNGKSSKEDNVKMLAWVVERLIRLFLGSLGRIERVAWSC